jgi:hypothetical protein
MVKGPAGLRMRLGGPTAAVNCGPVLLSERGPILKYQQLSKIIFMEGEEMVGGSQIVE